LVARSAIRMTEMMRKKNVINMQSIRLSNFFYDRHFLKWYFFSFPIKLYELNRWGNLVRSAFRFTNKRMKLKEQ
jgi:hypothetical protein